LISMKPRHFVSACFLCLLCAGCSGGTSASPRRATWAGEHGYGSVSAAITAKCGATELVYLFSLVNSYLNGARVDTFMFTPGRCGSPEQLVTGIYNEQTNTAAIDPTMVDNTGAILRPLPLADLKITFDQAVSIASNEAAPFLGAHPGATLIVGLSYRKSEPFQWEITFKKDGAHLTLEIDPASGKIISTPSH
jgi:hypothetical protein